jgi:hypothetical protein
VRISLREVFAAHRRGPVTAGDHAAEDISGEGRKRQDLRWSVIVCGADSRLRAATWCFGSRVGQPAEFGCLFGVG